MADLEAVISAAIGGLEGSDSSSDSGSDATDSAESGASSTGEGSTTESLGHEQHEQAPAPKRRGPIPFERHESVLANARAERQAELDRLNQQLQELSWAQQSDARAKIEAMDIADRDPQRFAQAMLSDPRYAQYFQQHYGQQAHAQAAPVQKEVEVPKPGPDMLSSDGSVSYSEEGLQKLLEWQNNQTQKALRDEFKRELEDRFGQVAPIVEQHKATIEWNGRLEKQGAILDNARQTWPMFRDLESDIRSWLGQRGNERATLDDAYRAVLVPKLQGDRDSMRASLIEELNAKPAAAQVRPPKAETLTPAHAGPRDMEDIIRESIRGLQG